LHRHGNAGFAPPLGLVTPCRADGRFSLVATAAPRCRVTRVACQRCRCQAALRRRFTRTADGCVVQHRNAPVSCQWVRRGHKQGSSQAEAARGAREAKPRPACMRRPSRPRGAAGSGPAPARLGLPACGSAAGQSQSHGVNATAQQKRLLEAWNNQLARPSAGAKQGRAAAGVVERLVGCGEGASPARSVSSNPLRPSGPCDHPCVHAPHQCGPCPCRRAPSRLATPHIPTSAPAQTPPHPPPTPQPKPPHPHCCRLRPHHPAPSGGRTGPHTCTGGHAQRQVGARQASGQGGRGGDRAANPAERALPQISCSRLCRGARRRPPPKKPASQPAAAPGGSAGHGPARLATPLRALRTERGPRRQVRPRAGCAAAAALT
jgi:hypothetical protein